MRIERRAGHHPTDAVDERDDDHGRGRGVVEPVGSTTSPATTTNTATVTTTRPTTTPYVVPVEPGVHISYAHAHHDYPASDIFATTGCGTTLVSPVNGRILEVRRTDGWDAQGRTTRPPAAA